MKRALSANLALILLACSVFAQNPPAKPAAEQSDATAKQQNETPEPKKIYISGSVLQGNAIKKVQPKYPKEAKKARVSGAVQVQVLIAETGKIISAEAISGPELLRKDSVKAAKKWVFKPTELSGVPVKVQGILTFNFTLQ